MAKRFKFRLQKVLEYRHMLKSDAQKELLVANNTLFSEQRILTDLETALLQNELTSNQVLSVGEIELYDQYSLRLRNDIGHQKVRVEEAVEAAEIARLAYIEAAKEAETLDKLKSKRKEEYRVYLEKEHEKFLDEFTTQRNGLGSATKE